VPSLRVDHVNAVWLPDENDGHLSWVEAWSPCQTRHADGLFVKPGDLADFLGLAVNEAELHLVVLEGDDLVVTYEEVVHDLTFQVLFLGEGHRKVRLGDFQDGDAVVRADHKLVVWVVKVVGQHLHFVDHAQRIEETA